MNDINENIIEFAISKGYDYALYVGDWNDYMVYEPIYWDDEIHFIGMPHSILYNDDTNEIRLTSDEECFEVLDAIDNDERNIENLPLEFEPELTIISFEFVRGGYPYVPDIYKYKSTKKHGKVLEYNNKHLERIDPIEIPIDNKTITIKPPLKIKIPDDNFDKYVLGMIKYFHEDFGENPNVCDGEWYEFKATLSNGQKLKSHGYNYFPYTYNKFVTFLEHYWKN